MATLSPLSTTFINAALHSSQLYGKFLDLVFPGGSTLTVPAHLTWIREIASVPVTGEALPAAMDALSSVQLGTAYHDRGLLQGSRNLYTTALRKLQQAITTGGTSDETLASIMLLVQCELFHEIAQVGRGWRRHVEGVSGLLQTIGPDAVKTRLGKMVFSHARLAAIYLGELSRKRLPFDDPSWLEATSDAPESDFLTRFIDIATGIPTILEQAAADFDESDILQEISLITDAAANLQWRLETWYQSFQVSDAGYETIDATKRILFQDFSFNGAFPTMYKFADVQTACVHILYWIARANIAQGVKTALHRAQFKRPNSAWESARLSAERDLYQYASNVCRSSAYCCKAQAASFSWSVALLCLVMAFEFFEEEVHQPERQWCRLAYWKIRSLGVAQPGPEPGQAQQLMIR